MSLRHQWLAEPLSDEISRALDRLQRAPDVEHIVVLPDVHLAKEVCVGTVVGTQNSLYPAAVGGDAGCGMCALPFDASAEELRDPRRAARVLAGLGREVPILKQARDAPELPQELRQRPLSDPKLEREKDRNARLQLGTLGRGNHFLELQSDEEGRLWLMTHSGSRAMGTLIRSHHEARGERVLGGLQRLDADSPAGRDYLTDLQWALDYAALNRERISRQACNVMTEELGVMPRMNSAFSCHHNFVRHETHAGKALWVHRKGAISARAGEMGILPGSMGTRSYHVEGRGVPESLCSSSHGAGRKLSRGEAHRHIRPKDLARQMRGVFHNPRLAARLLDEAPAAYKDVTAVLRAQKELLRVRRTLKPILVHKGG